MVRSVGPSEFNHSGRRLLDANRHFRHHIEMRQFAIAPLVALAACAHAEDGVQSASAAHWATVVIAALTVVLIGIEVCNIRRSIKVQKTRNNLDLFDRRINIILPIEQWLNDAVTGDGPDAWELRNLQHDLRHAKYLFDERDLDFLEEWHKKAIEFSAKSREWEPLRDRAYRLGEHTLSADEKKEKEEALNKMNAVRDFFDKERKDNRIDEKLGGYMEVSEIKSSQRK